MTWDKYKMTLNNAEQSGVTEHQQFMQLDHSQSHYTNKRCLIETVSMVGTGWPVCLDLSSLKQL